MTLQAWNSSIGACPIGDPFREGQWLPGDTLLRMQTAYELAQARMHESELVIDRLTTAA